MIHYKSPREIEKMREAGRIVAEVLDLISENIKPGVTTRALDRLAAEHFQKRKAKAAFLGYQGFPANICVSIDDEVVHGIPGERKLVEGQIVSVDVGSILEGYYGDAARSFPVGDIDPESRKLLAVTEKALHVGIDKCRVGNRLGEPLRRDSVLRRIPRLFGGARLGGTRHRQEDARGSPGSELRGTRRRDRIERRPDSGHRAHGEHRPVRYQNPS